MTGSQYRVQALARGLRVLSVFSEQRRELRLNEVVDFVNLPGPTVFRLLATLESEGFVQKSATGAYRPALVALGLGFAALHGSNLVTAATGPLEALAERIGETVNMGVLDGASVLYVRRIRNSDLLTANLQVGSVLPAACTSMGKVLLAFRDIDEVQRRVEPGSLQECQGPNAVRTLDELLDRLDEIRERGWGMQDQEAAHGLRSVAVPVRNAAQVVAAINVPVPAARCSMEELVERVLPELQRTADHISRSLGYDPHDDKAGTA